MNLLGVIEPKVATHVLLANSVRQRYPRPHWNYLFLSDIS